MARVSVLLTCYNHLAYLPTCLDSVRGQTFRDFEIIAIDDGSVDGTRDYLSRLGPEGRVILNENNLGTYATLNRALREANGEFIAVLNDDDVWDPQKLERQVEMLDSHPKVGLVHTDGRFIDGAGNRIEGSPLGFEFPRTETGDVLPALIYANKIIASAAVVRRACFDELGGFNDSYFGSGDWEMWLRIAEKWDVGYVDRELTSYRVHGTNASHKLERIWRDDERLRLWIRTRYDAYRESGRNAAVLKNAFAHNEACLGTVLKLNGKAKEARRAYWQSLRFAPFRAKSIIRLGATFLPVPLFRKLL